MPSLELAKCYQCYYALWIEPTADGKASVSTCYKNSFRRQNKLIVDRGLKDVWNSRQFQFQRRLAAKGDWGFCRGASCLKRWAIAAMDADPAVKHAAAAGKTRLDSFAKALIVAPSYACNYECYFCFTAADRRRGAANRLSDSLMEELKHEVIPLVDEVVVTGGEPFFTREGLELIDWVLSRFPEKKLLVMTNGALLREFGLERIVRHKIGLRISIYGMDGESSREMTGRDRFDATWRNIHELLSAGHEDMKFTYLVSSKSISGLRQFCEFIARTVGHGGIVQNSVFEGPALWDEMRRVEREYAHLSGRLIFDYRDETSPRRFLRTLYDPWHSLRYALFDATQPGTR